MGPLLKWRSMPKNTTNRKESYKPLWKPEELHSWHGWSHEGRLVGRDFPLLWENTICLSGKEWYMDIFTWAHQFGWGSGSKLQRSACLCPLHLCAGVVGTDHHSRLLHGFWGSELKSLSMYNKHLTKKTTPSQPSLGINFLNQRLRTCVCSYSLELWGGQCFVCVKPQL